MLRTLNNCSPVVRLLAITYAAAAAIPVAILLSVFTKWLYA